MAWLLYDPDDIFENYVNPTSVIWQKPKPNTGKKD